MRRTLFCLLTATMFVAPITGMTRPATASETAQPAPHADKPTEIWLDTDIGDDIDDAFALAVILRSPQLHLGGVITSLGDTTLRARLVERFLLETGQGGTPVVAGPATQARTLFTQSHWAQAYAGAPPSADAIAVFSKALRDAPPGTITLVALAPMTTMEAMIRHDPAAFARLKQVVMMGGSIWRGYGPKAGQTSASRSIEYNVKQSPSGLRAVLASGVPVVMMPLDATEIALDEADRGAIFSAGTPTAPVLKALYTEWAQRNAWGTTPTLFDVVPVAWLLDGAVCKPTPVRIEVTAKGMTMPVAGSPNIRACLDVDSQALLRLTKERLGAAP